MSTIPCSGEPRLIAQTLFLGASVAGFNVSKGWGGQPSQLTVHLIEDTATTGCLIGNAQLSKQYDMGNNPNNGSWTLQSVSDNDTYDKNHYHTCDPASNCYINSQNQTYTSGMNPSDRIVPGKVYYNIGTEYTAPTGVYSKYWTSPDPGFFGKPNRITPNNTYITSYVSDNSNLNQGYDIIDTPVYFKMGDFSFGGIVQGWAENISPQGGRSYTVNVYGMESILNNCYLILNKFAGAIYSRGLSGDHRFAGPRNYAGKTGVKYYDEISNGNLPNVFNIYGFLESLNSGGFGGARANSEGISANKILAALIVLTSTIDAGTKLTDELMPSSLNSDAYNDYGPKTAFSPFGRIVTKCMQELNSYMPISDSFNRFGVIPPSPVDTSTVVGGSYTSKCQFVLDLSDIPLLPNDFRIPGDVITITDFLNLVTEQSGYDYHTSLYPISYNGKIYNVIKIHTISRLKQPSTNEIKNTINNLACQNINISSITYGKEKNDTHARHLIIGGPQQRLYQAKSLRLAYSQSSYIFNPVTHEFIDYMKLGKWDQNGATARTSPVTNPYHHGKIKLPTALSTTNINLANIINPSYNELYNYEKNLLENITSIGTSFHKTDPDWNDNLNLNSSQVDVISGNYGKSKVITQKGNPIAWGNNTNERFFPLYMDVICPFFGFSFDTSINVERVGDKNNDFRKVRPVWFDTWTGQIVIVIRVSELPITFIELSQIASSHGVGYFLLTENEIRAALAGFDNFLVYSLSKTYKNDLIEMLRRAYKIKYFNEIKAANTSISDDTANKEAEQKSDWYWRLLGGNIAGPFNQTISIAPDKGDGSAELDPTVLKDLQILHSFVSEIGKYYGKKYMVMAPGLKAYRDDSFANIVLPTQAGDAYVFSGGGELHYSYSPTNDGAWEEYGNIIDDSISVGNKEWYNLTDDVGKIKPLLGYNINEHFDYVRYNICQLTKSGADFYKKNIKYDPFWSYDAYEFMMSLKDGSCLPQKFLLPSVDISSLNNNDYVIVPVSGIALGGLPSIATGLAALTTNNSYSFTTTTAKDAWGRELFDISGQSLPLKKLYLTTQVEENFIFLDPINLSYPRILIDAPGLTLNASSAQYAKDPDRTVISNVAIEDLSIYLHSVSSTSWDQDWINYMLSYASPAMDHTNAMIGNFASAANSSANFVELAPKAAHPFFAGIPIKSHQYSYGPWTNYPFVNWENIFPSGSIVTTNNSFPPSCTVTNLPRNQTIAKQAINNWITPTNVEVMEEFVPWNYGGMGFLDAAAYNEIDKKLNYQNILETAQIDIPSLPLFGLGGAFTSGNLNIPNLDVTVSGFDPIIKDVKDNGWLAALLDIMPMASALYATPEALTNVNSLDYKYIALTGLSNYTNGPIITNIQTSMGQGGITTTYSFRTYTKKIGLFNKENSDRIKRLASTNLKRNKQLANIQQQAVNVINSQSRFLQEKRLENASITGKDFSSKLYGWSPSTVLIAQSQPYIKYLDRDPPLLETTGLYSVPNALNSRSPGANFIWAGGEDIGSDSTVIDPNKYLTSNLASVSLSNTLRYKTSVGMYELKEVNAQLEKDYGMQSVMSLDGLLSPVSFYPTLKNSTFNYSLYETESCPFCRGTKIIQTEFTFYNPNISSVTKETNIPIYCDKCARLDELPTSKLKGAITTSSSTQSVETLPPYIITSGTDLQTLLDFKALSSSSISTSSSNSSNSNSASNAAGISIPINLVNLNPIVVPYGHMRNTNVQAYEGVHPEGSGIHGDLSIGIYTGASRTFFDRCRHSIEIVGRGSIKPKNLSIHNNLGNYINGFPKHQPDFYDMDLALQSAIKNRENIDIEYPMNQRFLGLRGPLVMHAWGYDFEGYPVPNAADEPYEIDKYGRPKRFKVKLSDGYPKSVSYKDLNIGELFTLTGKTIAHIKEKELINDSDTVFIENQSITNSTNVQQYKYEDDLSDAGGFLDTTDMSNDRTVGYQGSIISKTQQYTDGKWTDKKKLKEFYLNWAERPDLWPVGPIDLRWDESRRVWGMKSASTASIYKMVYVTLEEDLIKDDYSDTTYPARGFLDDTEYSSSPLATDYRRLVFVKDQAGYTAPRGAKLFCRYNKDSGYYEPVSKPSFTVKGIINNGTQATLDMAYIQGKKRGEVNPTMLVNFENPFKFNTIYNNPGLFVFNAGKWVLTATNQSFPVTTPTPT